MTYKKMLLMAGLAAFAATLQAQVTIDIDAQHMKTSTTLPTAASMPN